MTILGTPALAVVADLPQSYATRGTAYFGQAIAGGGTAPYSFAITVGALPPGLQMDSTGDITGTPTHAGNYSFTITATDATNVSGSGSASISVAGTTLSTGPISVAQGRVGIPYSPFTLTVSGGVPPYSASVTNTLPPGMAFDPVAMVFSGTPSTGGSYTIDFLLADQAGDIGTSAFIFPVPDITPATAPDGSLGIPYGAGFSTIGFNVNPTLTIPGALPPGLVFSSPGTSGELAGTPTAEGTFTFTVHAAGGSLTADRTYTLNILPGPPIIIAQSLAWGIIGVPYSQTINVFNATAPLTFTKTTGTVPPGLALSTSGTLKGTPTAVGSYGFGVTVQDSTGKTGSGNVSLTIVPPPLSLSPLTIPDGAIGQTYSVTFTGSGGVAPYNYSLSGIVPGLTLDSATGNFSGTPTAAGKYNITIFVGDNASATGSLAYTLTITGNTPPFTLTPLTLPDGTQGKLYSQVIIAPGALLPVHFVVSSGTTPAGLVFNTSIGSQLGIGGTPTTAGLYQFQITATDSNNKSVSQGYSINIASQTIVVSPNSLPPGIATVPYSLNFNATGGVPPYTFVARDIFSGGLTTPGGLLLSTSGQLSGAPAAGNWSFSIQATDSNGATGSWDYQLVVTPATLIVSPLQLPAGVIGTPYSALVVAYQGTPPYTFSLSSGPLPTGITLNPSGALTGTPQQAGLFNNISITARDSLGAAGSRSYQLMINGAPITVGPNSLPDAILNQPYSAQLTASGGTPPYTFTRPSANAWVPGLQVNADGSITGTPTNAGAALLDFTVVATDVNGSSGTHEFYINLRTGTLSLAPTVLPSATAGIAYGITLAASGGHAPYTFSLPVGIPLPAGLSLSPGGALSGTPASSGNDPFVIQVQDSNGANGSQAYLLNIAGPASISLAPTTIPAATTGTSYSTAITASGGIPPYLFSLAAGSNLPPGFSFSAGGVLSGMPTVAGSYPFTVQVQNNALATGTYAYVLNVANPCSYAISPGGRVFPSTGGSGSIAVTTDASCSWSITSVPAWVTLSSAASGRGSATVTFQVGVSNGPDQTATLMVAGLPFTVQQQAASIVGMNFAGSMPHTATAENWTTTFTLVANGSASAQTRLSVFGDDGSPLPVEFNLPQTPSSSGPLLAASLDRTIAPHALVVLDGLGPTSAPVQTGWAQLGATGTVGGFAIFHLIPGAQEAVVPLETRSASSYLLPFDNTNNVVLSVAVANLTAQTAHVGIFIRDETGLQIQAPGANITVGANGHQAFVLPTQFPSTANQRGTIEFDTPAGGRISVLGIRTTPLESSNSKTLTSVPALADVGTGGGSFAFLASGGDGWQTTFVLVNTGASASSATLSFLDPSGNPLLLPLSGSGASTFASSVTPTLAAGASYIVQSAGAPALLTGSAQLTTSGNISGFAIFRFNPTGQEAVLPLESRNAPAYLLAFDNTSNTATGIAVNTVSSSSQPVNIPVVVRDDAGNVLAEHNLLVPANGDFSGNLAQPSAALGAILFPETANIRGSIEFDAPVGVQIGVIGIRTPPANTYTTLPALAK